jgi:uncharacterized caspase-like protein
MGSHWAIAIGINQYEHFQPLMYAQRDAQMLHQFLRNEAGFPPHQCLLFSDLSSSVEPDSIPPTRDNLVNVISQLCQQKLQPDDVLLLFFCGYGVRFKDKEYLMTVESDPAQLPFTGIEIEFLLTKLKTAPTRQILLIFDMDRSQGALEGNEVGERTLQLAQKMGIATFLSCQPQQFSHETLALRQGLYTAGLLEALRYGGCVTPEQLATYLTQRLPQLSEHYWRPTQNPVSFVPPEMRYTLLIPGKGDRPNAAPVQAQPLQIAKAALPDQAALAASPLRETLPLETVLPHGSSPLSSRAPAAYSETVAQDFWRRLMTWGIPLALVLCAGVLINHGDELFGSGPSSPGESPTVSPRALPSAAPIAASSSVPPAASTPVPPTLQGVETALNSSQFANALTALEQIPADQRDGDLYQALLNQAAEGVLREARAATQGKQASDFNLGIQRARQLRAEHPFYREAQQDIRTWSQSILDLALGRANQPNQGDLALATQNFRAAILAAQLVPSDQNEIYINAQREIATWSRGILNLANEHARSNNVQAAIATAQQLPANTPDYDEAQAAIERWRSQ